MFFSPHFLLSLHVSKILDTWASLQNIVQRLDHIGQFDSDYDVWISRWECEFGVAFFLLVWGMRVDWMCSCILDVLGE
jgi:hypothetical protein